MAKDNSTKKKDGNIHKDHRKRLKEKFIKSGFNDFAEHEIIEFLLFYSIPQGDTNPLAHKLLNNYKSLSTMFDASMDSLMKNTGIGSHTAILIKMIPAIMQIYNCQKAIPRSGIKTHRNAIEFIEKVFMGLSQEEFYVFCLDSKSRVKCYKKIANGDFNKVEVPIRTVTNYVFNNDCQRIIIAHNHPNSSSTPSDEDVVLTHKLFSSCVLNDIDLIDHIIYSPTGSFSFAASGIMTQIKRDVLTLLNYDKNSVNFHKFCESTEDYIIESSNNDEVKNSKQIAESINLADILRQANQEHPNAFDINEKFSTDNNQD